MIAVFEGLAHRGDDVSSSPCQGVVTEADADPDAEAHADADADEEAEAEAEATMLSVAALPRIHEASLSRVVDGRAVLGAFKGAARRAADGAMARCARHP